jgi:hypothetical protein
LLNKNNTATLIPRARIATKFTLDLSTTTLQENKLYINRVNNETFYNFKLNRVYDHLTQYDKLVYSQSFQLDEIGYEYFDLGYTINSYVKLAYKHEEELARNNVNMIKSQITILTSRANNQSIQI